MAAPVSNGAIVQDETALNTVAVNFNFSNTGSGGTLEVLQSNQISSITSGYPPASDSRWTTAIDANGNVPTEGAQSATWSHVGFTQPRGTIRYYYSRRKNGNTIELGSPYPVGEYVPSQPFIHNVVFNANYTQATVDAAVSDSITTLYYYQSTNQTQPTWQAVSPTQTTPDAVWQTSNVFTTVPGISYYYYVLAWTHNNPGPDGAAISPSVSRFSGDAMGLEVFNASGKKIVSLVDRLVRFVSTGTVTVSRGGYVDVSVSGMANDDTWLVLLGFPPGIFWSTEARVAKQTNSFRITYLATANLFGITGPSAVLMTYYVYRS